jgi:hypothetical protein
MKELANDIGGTYLRPKRPEQLAEAMSKQNTKDTITTKYALNWIFASLRRFA